MPASTASHASPLAKDRSPPPSASASTFSKSHSFRAPPSNINTVVTVPPWARDEPPSPTDLDQNGSSKESRDYLSALPPASDVRSYQSSADESAAGPSRWWAFTRHRGQDPPSNAPQPVRRFSSLKAPPLKDRSMSLAWLTRSASRKSADDEHSPVSHRGKDREAPRAEPPGPIALQPPAQTFTLQHSNTPGWDTPWSPRPPGHLISRTNGNGAAADYHDETHDEIDEKHSSWTRRKKRFRMYILHNVYVPLLFRFVNITFTTAALAIAIRIRAREERLHVMGALGASPTLVIIFAPLTLVHVMVAIYLEYFGRPLGLWRTSWKLAYTLVEVVFICAWSAALALCFDNFFTSIIPCASPSSTAWYNELPPRPTIPNLSSHQGESICDEQLALICLVGVGLIMYCYNLVISLFRIFEKVKYHPGSLSAA